MTVFHSARKGLAALALIVLLIFPVGICRVQAAVSTLPTQDQASAPSSVQEERNQSRLYSEKKDRNLIVFFAACGGFLVFLGLAKGKQKRDDRKRENEPPYAFDENEELILKRRKNLKTAEKIRQVTYFAFIISSCVYMTALTRIQPLFHTQADTLKLATDLLLLWVPGLLSLVRKEKTKFRLNVLVIFLFAGISVYFIYCWILMKL